MFLNFSLTKTKKKKEKQPKTLQLLGFAVSFNLLDLLSHAEYVELSWVWVF